MSTPLKPQDDVNPSQVIRDLNDVEFADDENKKYPIDTPNHVRAAWCYIHQPDNAAKYNVTQIEVIVLRIRLAATKHGVVFDDDEETRKTA